MKPSEDRKALLRDAARWRALVNSPRTHFMGSAGVDYGPKPEQLPSRREGADIHFGMEFWEINPYDEASDEASQARNRALLTLFADRLVEIEGEK